MADLRRNDLVYPQLSYQIIGCAYDAYNALGPGHHEKVYQRGLYEIFKAKNIPCQQQVYYPVMINGKVIGKNFFDFFVDNKIIVEIKKGNRYSKQHIDQVLAYLKTSKSKLAILINFGSDDVSFKRIVNFET